MTSLRLIALGTVVTVVALPSRAAAVVNVTCVGDSITQGFMIPDPSLTYPNDLNRLLGSGYTVGNYGVSGATMQKAPVRTDSPSYWSTSAFPLRRRSGTT
jgi:lysophospholipase L1-like esterase